jgi:hypothetical protein
MTMKKWIAGLAALVLGLAFAGCDFGTDEEGDSEGYYEDFTENGEDAVVQEDTGGGQDNVLPPEDFREGQECTAGQAAGYVKIRIEDDPGNPTLVNCNSNPGADIDAVCLYGPNDEELGCAGTVLVEEIAPVCDKNDKADPQQVIGINDGIAGPDDYVGYYSLNGGAIVVTIREVLAEGMGETDIELLCGDVVHVWEMYNAADPQATVEKYKVSLGTADDQWKPGSDFATGEIDVPVSWVW